MPPRWRVNKFTSEVFAVNATKCQFCKPEIKFLGHIISAVVVKADSERIEAILRYPVPKKQRELRKFLGKCNFRHQFILNYSSHLEALFMLLRKGIKWRWTAALQQAFVNTQIQVCPQYPIDTSKRTEGVDHKLGCQWPCRMFSVITREGRRRIQCMKREDQQDATIRCLLLTSISTCFGHNYAHLQEIK